MDALDLNNPDVRHERLVARLRAGDRLVAAALAEEFGISLDTVRRDLTALERTGHVRRVRGGAVPLVPPAAPFAVRERAPEPGLDRLSVVAAGMIDHDATLLLDGGTTVRAVLGGLNAAFRGLVITPAPTIAVAAQARGIAVHLIGGTLSVGGAIATGGDAERAVADCAADLCLLGACALHPSFGLGADDAGEAGIKRAMALASTTVAVVAGAGKLSRRARHRVLALDEIDHLVTGDEADPATLAPFAEAGVAVHRG